MLTLKKGLNGFRGQGCGDQRVRLNRCRLWPQLLCSDSVNPFSKSAFSASLSLHHGDSSDHSPFAIGRGSHAPCSPIPPSSVALTNVPSGANTLQVSLPAGIVFLKHGFNITANGKMCSNGVVARLLSLPSAPRQSALSRSLTSGGQQGIELDFT